ncbi:hypothetical protein CDD83_10142 [Cordyceps sp. RAO-2017]|nr:hypothetical protein CDD83_10142 [Cordyceps sp. RAO-2017]
MDGSHENPFVAGGPRDRRVADSIVLFMWAVAEEFDLPPWFQPESLERDHPYTEQELWSISASAIAIKYGQGNERKVFKEHVLSHPIPLPNTVCFQSRVHGIEPPSVTLEHRDRLSTSTSFKTTHPSSIMFGRLTLVALVGYLAGVRGLTATMSERVAKEYSQKLVDDLSHKIQVNWDNPPIRKEAGEITESTCFQHWEPCSETTFQVWEIFHKGSYNLSIDFDVVPHTKHLNLGERPLRVDAAKSIWNSVMDTNGWDVSADFQSRSGVSLGAGHSSSKSKTGMTVESQSSSSECMPGYECGIDLWIYHANYEGDCTNKPMIICGPRIAHDVCPILDDERQRKDKLICNQWIFWSEKMCVREDGPQFKTNPLRPCKLRVPIIREDGIPLATVVWRERKATLAPMAIWGNKDCVFYLDTREYYDSVSDTYHNATSRLWEHRPKALLPYIPESKRHQNCPSSTDSIGWDAYDKEYSPEPLSPSTEEAYDGDRDSQPKPRGADVSSYAAATKMKRSTPHVRLGEVRVKVLGGFQGFQDPAEDSQETTDHKAKGDEEERQD